MRLLGSMISWPGDCRAACEEIEYDGAHGSSRSHVPAFLDPGTRLYRQRHQCDQVQQCSLRGENARARLQRETACTRCMDAAPDHPLVSWQRTPRRLCSGCPSGVAITALVDIRPPFIEFV